MPSTRPATIKQIIKDNEINKRKINSQELHWLINTASTNPEVVNAIYSNLHIYPIFVEEYLDELLSNGKIKQYELAKLLIQNIIF